MRICFKSIQGIGKREIQEDALFFKEGKNAWAIVCDGIGGSNKGEVASGTSIQQLKKKLEGTQVLTEDRLATLIEEIQIHLAEIQKIDPLLDGMGTTLSMCFQNENQLLVAHIGDSPIFHIRDGKILWRSKDHSLVNQLLDLEIITPEEALNHPQKNVITRAIKAKKESKPVKADFHALEDFQDNDMIFICSDGVMEAVNEAQLCAIFSKFSLDDIALQLRELCQEYSNDNYSAIFGQAFEE